MFIRLAELLAIMLLTAALWNQALAQEAGSLEAGDVVRLQTNDTTVVGDLVAITPAQLILRVPPGSETQAFSRTAISRLEVKRSYRDGSNWWKGAAIGGFAGFAIAAGISNATSDPDAAGGENNVALAGAVGFVVGAGAGALIATGQKKHAWVRVPLDGLEVGIGPTRSGGIAAVIAIPRP